ncbi:MAG: MprA protease, GlyGly-CTERM protein-sorting domain-containing form, partial [Pseudomonas sp.]
APQPAAAVSMAVAGALAIAGLVTWQLRRRRSAHALRAGHRHAVGHGEDIQAIAADYDADWKKIAKANRLKPPYSLKPGQAIVIPASHASNRRRA